MSYEKQLICPTLEEIDLIRKKLNSIVDIPYIKENKSKHNLYNNYSDSNDINKDKNNKINQLNEKIKELENILNSNSYKINNYDNILNENKELNNILNKLKYNNPNNNNNNLSNYDINDEEDKDNYPKQILDNIKNNSTKNYNNSYNNNLKYSNSNDNFNNIGYKRDYNFYKNNINKNNFENINLSKKESSYKNFKNASEPEIINKLLNKNKYLNEEIDKLKRELYLTSKQNMSNKEILANYIQQILDEHKGELNSELIKYLLDRIDKLEYQNFFLSSKIENLIIIMNQYIEELCEYIDIIFDLGNVINDIPDNIINQNLNEDFFIVRDTLNNKKDYLNKKYEEYNNFKNKLNTNDVLKNNEVLIMLGNKINDINNTIKDDKISNEYSKIIDEKIQKYENIMNPNNIEENKNFIDKELLITNNILSKQNSELRQVIKDILANDIYSTPVINAEIKEKLINILNDNKFGQKTNNSLTGFCTYEDLLMMLNIQCYINEIQMNQNNI